MTDRPLPRPGSPPPPENMFDEGVRTIGKAGKLFFDWLTSETDDAFLDQVDREHGTSTRAMADKIRGKKSRLDALGAELEAGPGARRDPPSATPELPAGEVIETEAEIVIVDDGPPECDFCHGKPVCKLDRVSKKKIRVPCPSCGKKG